MYGDSSSYTQNSRKRDNRLEEESIVFYKVQQEIHAYIDIYISSTMVDVNYLFRRTVLKKLFGAEITMAAIGELIRIQNEETR